jgi:hypothetical protein
MKLPLMIFLLSVGALGLTASLWLLRPTEVARQPVRIAVAPATAEPTVSTSAGLPAARDEPARRETVPATPAAVAPVPPGDQIDQVLEWARRDPAQAAAWLAQAPPGEKRDAVIEIVCAEVAQFDPAQAVALAERFAGGNINLLENLVFQWAERDNAFAAAYANAKAPGELRDRLVSRVALQRAKTQPVEAAKWVVEKIPPGDIQREAIISVLHQWARQDAGAAEAWARTFPPGDLRNRAMQEIAASLPR